MAQRQLFRSSRPTTRRLTTSRRLAQWAVVAAVGIGAAVYFLSPRVHTADEFRRHFDSRRSDFVRLRNMISSERAVASIGADNVGEFWLFDGTWTASDRKFVAYSRREMLEAAGLPASRYETYLTLLSRVGAYRVSRQSVIGSSLRGTVFLFPDAQGRGPSANIVFSETPPEPLLPWSAARRSSRPSYVSLGDGWFVEFQNR